MLRSLTVTVVEGKGLIKADMMGGADPFTVVVVGTQRKQTTTKKDTRSPKWNEAFVFQIDGEQNIELEVIDWDRVGHNDLMGTGLVPISEPLLKELRRGGAKVNVPLQLNAKSAGTLHLIVQGEFADAEPTGGFGQSSSAASYPPPRRDSHEDRRDDTRDKNDALERQRREHEEEARALRGQIHQLQSEIDKIKSHNQDIAEESRNAVEPLKRELKNNRALLAQAVQCIEDLAENQKKMERRPRTPSPRGSPRDSESRYGSRYSDKGRSSEPRFVHNRKAPHPPAYRSGSRTPKRSRTPTHRTRDYSSDAPSVRSAYSGTSPYIAGSMSHASSHRVQPISSYSTYDSYETPMYGGGYERERDYSPGAHSWHSYGDDYDHGPYRDYPASRTEYYDDGYIQPARVGYTTSTAYPARRRSVVGVSEYYPAQTTGYHATAAYAEPMAPSYSEPYYPAQTASYNSGGPYAEPYYQPAGSYSSGSYYAS